MKAYRIITVLDSLSETSMPWNEFVLYRHKQDPTPLQAVIVCQDERPEDPEIPEDLKILWVGKSRSSLREAFLLMVEESRNQGIPWVVHLHQLKSALQFFQSVFFQKGWRGRTLFTIHSAASLRDWRYRTASLLCGLLATRVTCVGKAAYEASSPLLRGLKGKNFSSISNGVDILRIDGTPAANGSIMGNEPGAWILKEPGDWTIIDVGRIIPLKNQGFLLELMKELPDCRLVLIGEEDGEGAFRRKVSEAGLESRVELTGKIARDQVYARLKAGDVYVSPSLAEGMPVSVLEAMACSLPVVLSDIAPHLEIASFDDCVLAIPLSDKDRWIRTLKDLRAKGEINRQGIGSCCRRIAETQFSLGRMHQRYELIYEELAGRRRG